ncbi:alpha/beta hydrolase [Amycolatopsis sp. lyj-90]|uniref:alpha/beta hydrolase n=1 Tax=Amycolatopsis sp. lyj-90 TaxID=2789285 RepID=UPI003977EA80
MFLSVPPLPDRAPDIVRGLPGPFARAQLDGFEPAFALDGRGRPLVSTDAWSGRHLAVPETTGWRQLTSGSSWYRRPQWTNSGLTCEVFDDLASESGRMLRLSAPGMPLADAPEARTVRRNPDLPGRVAFLTKDGWSRVALCQEDGKAPARLGNVVELGPWLGRDEVLVTRERWPSRQLCRWDVTTGAVRSVLAGADLVVSGVRRVGDVVGLCWTSTGQPRRLELLPVGRIRRAAHLPVVPGSRHAPTPTRAVVIDGPACRLPCLWYEPDQPPRGTIVILHGGPNGMNVATWSPFADSLVLDGWRVVLPNVRGSGILDPSLRPPRPARYGDDDVKDVLAVVRRFATGPVVLGGRSYGGYLAARTAAESTAIKAVFLLGGFFATTDLDEAEHPGVAAFLGAPGTRFAPDRPPAAVPHFVAHGRGDQRIPVGAVTRHADRLASGSEVVVLAGEGHGVRTDAGARRVFPALLRWLEGIG